MFLRKEIILFLVGIAMVTHGYHCFAQRWAGMDKGFICFYAGASGYELAIDNKNQLCISGTLPENGYCEEWRVPARWNGNSWDKLGDLYTSIYFLTLGSYKDTLYTFNSYYGNNYSNFLKWNGTTWDSIAGGPSSVSMYAMLEYDGVLYASGAFEKCAGDSANLVFSYDGYEVKPLVRYFDYPSLGLALAFYHDTLFVAGSFRNEQDQIFHFGSVYDFDIHQVGQGLQTNCIVEAMEVHDGVLWLGGTFGPGNFGSDQFNFLAYYDGHSIQLSPWQPDGRVVALKSHNNELYVAGWFAHIEELEAHCVAKINDFGYFSLNPDTVYSQAGHPASYSPGIVRDIEVWNDTLYLSGAFGSIGSSTELNCIAKLNRSLSANVPSLPENVLLYPNPFNDYIILETGALFLQNAHLNLYDTAGKRILTDSWPSGERKRRMPLGNLPSGLYLLTIESNQGRITKRIVKE